MLPSTGYFKGITCPFFESGLCERPYCHFRHIRRDPEINNETLENSDILKQLVSEAVKKVLQQSEAGTSDIETKSQSIISQVVEELKPSSFGSPKDLPTQKATYNPTPIAELNKMNPAVSNQVRNVNKSENRRHIPVPYTPHRPSRTQLSRLPVKLDSDSTLSLSVQEACAINPMEVDQNKYTPSAIESESLVKYLPGSAGNNPTPYSPIAQSTSKTESVAYTPSNLTGENEPIKVCAYSPAGQNTSSGVTYKPGVVQASASNSYCPTNNSTLDQVNKKPTSYSSKFNYKPTPLTKSPSPTFSADEDEEPATKKAKYNNPEELDDLDLEFELLGEILEDENNASTIINKMVTANKDNGCRTESKNVEDGNKTTKNATETTTTNINNNNFDSIVDILPTKQDENKSSKNHSHKSQRSKLKSSSDSKTSKHDSNRDSNSSKIDHKHSTKKKEDEGVFKEKDKSSKHRSSSVDTKSSRDKSKESKHTSSQKDKNTSHRSKNDVHKKTSSEVDKKDSSDDLFKKKRSKSSSSHRDSTQKHKDKSSRSTSSSSSRHNSKSEDVNSKADKHSHSKSSSSKHETKTDYKQKQDEKSQKSSKHSSKEKSTSKESSSHRKENTHSTKRSHSTSKNKHTKEIDLFSSAKSDESDKVSDVSSVKSDVIEIFSDSDEESITQECLKIFQEYTPVAKETPTSDTSNKHDSEDDSAQASGKKRIAHNTNITIYRKANPTQPDHKSKALQMVTDRYSKVKKFHEERSGTKPATSMLPVHNEPSVSNVSSSSKVRIAHVPYATTLISAKKALKVPEPPPPPTPVQTVAKGSNRVAHMPNDKFSDRPTPLEPMASKVPINIRSKYLNMMIDECLKIYLTAEDAYERALQEELCTNKKCNTIAIYKNSALLTISRLRKEIKEADGKKITSNSKGISHSKVMLGKKGETVSWSIENKYKKHESDIANELKGKRFYGNIFKWILSEEQLQENGFPRPHPDKKEKGWAKIYRKNPKQKPPKGFTRTCNRCQKEYDVDKKGIAIRREECIYHPNNKYRYRGEVKYQCCNQDGTTDGCLSASCHVFEYVDHENLRGYVTTLPKEDESFDHGVYALDCEMCYTTNGLDLTRVTVINSNLKVVYESLVRPIYPIIDYNTKFSGITEDQMRNVNTSLLEVQATLLHMFSDKTILVGHSLESDFKALKLIHNTVVDTSVLFPHKMGPPYKRALRNLASEYLKKIIQNSLDGHDSAEDALVCMELLMWKVKEELKIK